MGSIAGSNYSASKRDHIIFGEIIDRVAKYYKINESTLLGYQRTGEVVIARHTIYFACRLKKMNYAAIAHIMGRDHTTIIMGVRSLQKKIIDNPSIYDGVLVAVSDKNNQQ